MPFVDRDVLCVSCGLEFVFSVGRCRRTSLSLALLSEMGNGAFRFAYNYLGLGIQEKRRATPGFIDQVNSGSVEQISHRFCKKRVNFTGACQAKTHNFSTGIHDVRHQQIKRRIGEDERVKIGDFAILPDKGSKVPRSPVD